MKLKNWQRTSIGLGLYAVFIIILWLPIWIPRDWLIIAEATPKPTVSTQYDSFWITYLCINILILAILGCNKISNITEWILSHFWGKKPIDCWVEMTVDLVNNGLTEDRARDIVSEWIYKYDLKEKFIAYERK